MDFVISLHFLAVLAALQISQVDNYVASLVGLPCLFGVGLFVPVNRSGIFAASCKTLSNFVGVGWVAYPKYSDSRPMRFCGSSHP